MFRRYKQRRFSINQFEVRKQLEADINDDEDIDDEYIAYYKHVRENLDKAVSWNSDESNCSLDIKDIKNSTEIPC